MNKNVLLDVPACIQKGDLPSGKNRDHFVAKNSGPLFSGALKYNNKSKIIIIEVAETDYIFIALVKWINLIFVLYVSHQFMKSFRECHLIWGFTITVHDINLGSFVHQILSSFNVSK